MLGWGGGGMGVGVESLCTIQSVMNACLVLFHTSSPASRLLFTSVSIALTDSRPSR